MYNDYNVLCSARKEYNPCLVSTLSSVVLLLRGPAKATCHQRKMINPRNPTAVLRQEGVSNMSPCSTEQVQGLGFDGASVDKPKHAVKQKRTKKRYITCFD